jgi:hypothetical protein
MRLGRAYRGLTVAAFVALMALALTALVLDAGSVPHAHFGLKVGLYNQEHDLTYLATFGGGAPLPEGAALPVAVVVAVAVCVLVPLLASPPRRLADSRAPPTLL